MNARQLIILRYDNLQKYNLPRPTAIFELEYFKKIPLPSFYFQEISFLKDTNQHFERVGQQDGSPSKNSSNSSLRFM